MSGFTLPTSRPITQPWGAEFDDWDGDGVVDYPGGFYHSIGWDGHNGIDYGCYTGDPIEAVADGVVAFAGDAGNWHRILSGGGNAVLVEHPDHGVQTEYLHLSRWAVSAGQAVTCGQVIGYSGATGAATAPHLHLGMLRLAGYNLGDRWRGRIDPTPYLYGALNPDYAGIAAQGTIQEDDMALTEQNLKDIALHVWAFKNEQQDSRDMRQIVADGERHNNQIPGGTYWGDLIGAVDKINGGVDNLVKRPAADIAAQLDAAGIAADVRDELVKLLGGK